MFNIFSHQGNANQNQHEIPLHSHQNGYYSKKQNIGAGEDVEKLEPSCIAGGNEKWCSHRGKTV